MKQKDLFTLSISCGQCETPIVAMFELPADKVITKMADVERGLNKLRINCPKDPNHVGVNTEITNKFSQVLTLEKLKEYQAEASSESNEDTITT